ncbi:MAG TPA: DUF6112 family protein [Miltoncostaeaceae bacterium]|nr:DUF6112 family protein [Miltoncostaeaceae bacterium]
MLSSLVLQVNARPDPNGLPGQDKLQSLVDGLYSWALLLILAALVVAAIAWAWGAQSNHHGAASGGRRGVLLAAAAGLLVGMAPQIVNFFYRVGRS